MYSSSNPGGYGSSQGGYGSSQGGYGSSQGGGYGSSQSSYPTGTQQITHSVAHQGIFAPRHYHTTPTYYSSSDYEAGCCTII